MKGFLSLEPDAATLATLVARQNRLRDALARQGVSFPDRLNAPLLAWPFATHEELGDAATLLAIDPPELALGPLGGFPSDDRPAEIGHAVERAAPLQAELWRRLRERLDPDPPKPVRVRLARVAPASRKVGIALRQANLLGSVGDSFVAGGLAIWTQTPHGFEIYRRIRLGHGGP